MVSHVAPRFAPGSCLTPLTSIPRSSTVGAYSRCPVLHVCVLHERMEFLFRPVRDRALALLLFQIFPDPSDFDRCCKLKDRLPSIVVEPTEGEVESGELRWPPEEFLVQEDEQDNCEETVQENKEQ